MINKGCNNESNNRHHKPVESVPFRYGVRKALGTVNKKNCFLICGPDSKQSKQMHNVTKHSIRATTAREIGGATAASAITWTDKGKQVFPAMVFLVDCQA